jgi:hypothetical protein
MALGNLLNGVEGSGGGRGLGGWHVRFPWHGKTAISKR